MRNNERALKLNSVRTYEHMPIEKNVITLEHTCTSKQELHQNS